MSTAYMTAKEIANEMQVTPAAVYKWIKAGKLPAVRAGGAVRITRAAFAAFVQPAASQEAR
jgi:excisionase family DNA binding protein